MSESVMMPELIVVKPEAMETGSDDESAADLPLDPVTLTSVQTSPGNGEVVSALPPQMIADTLQQQTPTTPSSSSSSVAVASADGKTLKCPKCNWRYKYQEALETHLADKHPEQAGGGAASCRYCLHDEPHPRLPRGETHVCGYKPYRCDVCAYSTNSRGNLAIHMQSEKHLRSISQQPLVSSSPLTIPPSGDSSITAADAEDEDGDEMQNSGSGSGVGEPQQEPLRRSLLPPSSRRPMRCDVCNFETTATRYMRTHMASEKHLNAMVLAVGALKRQQQQLLTQQHSPCPSPPANGFPPPFPASFPLPHPHPPAARAADVIGSGSLSEGQGQTKDGGLFQCLVCSAFTCDSLAEMNKHIQRDRSHDTSRSTSIVDGVSYDCLVCPYRTTIRTNFNLHCKTEKHVLNVQLANHAFEGGQIVDTTNRDLVKFLPQVKCMACDAVAVSVYKMEVHLTDARHIKNSNVFNHIGELENQLINRTGSKKTAKLQQLTYECKLCSFTCRSKADLMKHIDTPRHIQLECLQQMDELKTGRLFSLNHFIAVSDLPSHYDNSRASTLESVALDVVLCPLCQEPQKSMAALEAHLTNNHKVTKEGIKVLLSVVKPSPSEPPSDVEASFKTKHSRKSATPAQLVGFGGRRESDEDNSGQCLNLVKAESYDSFGALDLKVRDRASLSDGDASNDRPESSHRTKLHDRRTSFDSAESDINDNLIWREKADAESTEKLLRCVSCRATFDSIVHLNAHLQQEPSCHALAADHSVDPQVLRYMDPSRPFKCQLCRESFTQKSILHAHFNSVSHLHHMTQLGGSASAAKLTSSSSATTRDGGFLAAEPAGSSAKAVRNTSSSSVSSSNLDRNVSAGDKTSKPSSSSAASSSIAQTTAGTGSGVLPFTPAMFQQAAAAGMYNPLFSFYSAYNAGQLASLMPFASAASFPFSQADYQKMLASFTAAQQQQKPALDVAAASKADGGKTTGSSSSSSANRHFAATAEMKPSLVDIVNDAADKSLHDDYGQDTSERMLQEIAKVCDALSAGGVGQARIRRSQTHMKMLRNIGMECVLQFLEADRQPLDRGLPANKTVDESVAGIDNTAGKDDATGIAVKREEAEVDNRKKVVEDMDTSGHLPCSKCSRRFSSVWILKAHEEADHGLIISSVVLEAIAKVVQESQPEAAAEMQQNVANTMLAPPPPYQLTSGSSVDDKMSASKSKAASVNLVLSSPSDVNKSALIPAAEDGHSKSAEPELTSHAAAVNTSKSLSTPTPAGVNMLPMPLSFPMPLAMGAMTAAGAGMMPVFMPFAAPGARTIAPPIGAGGAIPPAALAAQATLSRPPVLAPVGLAAAANNTGAHQSTARLTAAATAANIAANAAESDDKGGQGYQRRPRTRINEEQLKVLRANFDINNPPGETEIKRMVNDTGLPFQVIKHWFRNTLFKERQRNIDSPYNFSNPPTTTLSLDEQGMPQTKKDAIKAGTIPEVDESNASADETARTVTRQAQTVVEHAQPTPPPPFPATTLQRAVSCEEPPTPVTPIIIQPIANNSDKESCFESLLEDAKVAVDKKTSLENKEKMLWSFFKQNPYPIPAVVQQLVVKLGMQPNEITRWFRKTRRKERKLTDVADYGSAMMVQDGKSLTALIFPGQQQQESGSAVSVSASVSSPGSTPPISADVLAPHANSNILNLAGGTLHNVKYESGLQQEIAERNGNTSLATDFSKVKDELAENGGAAAMYDEDDGHSTDSDSNIKDSPPSILANKRLRTALTPQQIDQLCREYTDDNYPSMEKMARIAESLGLKHRVVRVWFQNRRAYTKKGLVAPYMPTDVNSMPFSFSMAGNGFVPSKRAHDDDSSSRNADDDYSSLAADNDLHADDLIIDLSLTEADDSEEAASPSKRSKMFDEDMEVDYAGESKGGLKMNSQLSASMSSMFPGMNFGTGGNGSGYVRRNRTQLSLLQIRAMVAIYRDDTMPTATQCELLGHAIGLPRRVVQVWFQNQRAKEKRGVNCQQRLATLMSDAGGEALSDTIHLSLTPGECRLCFEAYGDSSAMSAHIFSANHLHRLIVHLSAGKTGKAAAAAATTAEGKTKYESQTQVKNAVSHTDSKNNIATLPTPMSGLAAMIPGMLTGDSKVIPPSSLAMSAAAPITSPTAAPFVNMESFYMYNMAMALGSPLAMLQIPAAAITSIQRQLDDNSGSTVAQYFNDGLSFSDLANVVTAKDVDNTREVSVDVGFICRKCRMVYPIREACVGHQRFACYAAVAASGSWDPTQTSVKLEQRQFECQPCGVRCSSVSDYHAHCLTPRHVAALL